jgi:hypothetical protein
VPIVCAFHGRLIKVPPQKLYASRAAGGHPGALQDGLPSFSSSRFLQLKELQHPFVWLGAPTLTTPFRPV